MFIIIYFRDAIQKGTKIKLEWTSLLLHISIALLSLLFIKTSSRYRLAQIKTILQGCRGDGISIHIPAPYPYPWGFHTHGRPAILSKYFPKVSWCYMFRFFLRHLVNSSTFRKPTSAYRASLSTQHIRPSGVFDRQSDGLEFIAARAQRSSVWFWQF